VEHYYKDMGLCISTLVTKEEEVSSMSFSKRKRVWLSLISVLTAILLTVSSTPTISNASTSAQIDTNPSYLQIAFDDASREFNIPLSVLMSIAYNESRWETHEGEPSVIGGYGVMHLTQANEHLSLHSKGDEDDQNFADMSDPAMYTLDKAASLLGVEPDVLKQDAKQNIRGGAALLAEYARGLHGNQPENPADWYGVVAKYSGSGTKEIAEGFANDVYTTIQQGAERNTSEGQHVKLTAVSATPNKSTADSLHLRNAEQTNTDCPNGLACRYIPAAYKQYSSSKTDYGNYDTANRPNDGLDIKYIIIHDVEGSYESAISTFQSKSYVSAHYVIRSSDGQITQMLRPKDIGWHAGNWYLNAHSIGIEHSGFAAVGGEWYSEQLYRSSARLVKYLAEQYNIPIDRQHILGHDDLPGLTPYNQTRMHWDPGAYWDWAHYFDLLGASLNPNNADKGSNVVTIVGNYHTNEPDLLYGNKQLEAQSSSFVYLHTAPSFDAPLLSDPALHPDGKPGTTQINDWGDKASFGQSFYQADQQGDWTAIYFGGQIAWFYNPQSKNTVPGNGILVTPKAGQSMIPIYGAAFPETAAYTKLGIPARVRTPLQYAIPSGQVYVATGPIQSSEYYAKLYNAPNTYKIVMGEDEFYQISFGHRIAFVKKNDVDVIYIPDNKTAK
jgi:N-acetyl-anhydromuramyl-L-alanine amidase AmpD